MPSLQEAQTQLSTARISKQRTKRKRYAKVFGRRKSQRDKTGQKNAAFFHSLEAHGPLYGVCARTKPTALPPYGRTKREASTYGEGKKRETKDSLFHGLEAQRLLCGVCAGTQPADLSPCGDALPRCESQILGRAHRLAEPTKFVRVCWCLCVCAYVYVRAYGCLVHALC